jgi:hypothetical protein
MATRSVVNPTAKDVRAFYRANPDRMARLDDEARLTVLPGARGLLHADVETDYNKGRKADRQYVRGAAATAREANQAQRKALKAAGLLGAKARGPLSPAAKEFLAQSKG